MGVVAHDREVRRYNTRGALFDFVYPKRSVFKGGIGAFEATINATYTDANSGTIQGGKLWRVSPMSVSYTHLTLPTKA